jgi:hypothetical protein
VWVCGPGEEDSRGAAVRVDPSVDRWVARITADGGSPAVARDAIWTTQAGALLRTDPETNRLLPRVRLDSVSLTDGKVGEGAVWAAANGAVLRVDPDRADRQAPVGITQPAHNRNRPDA